MAGKDLRLALLDRELLLDAGTMGEAVHSDGALVAVRTTGRTAEGTQLDDGLVVATGMRLVEEGLRQIPVGAYATCRVDGLGRAEEATQHAVDIAVHSGVREVVGEGEDRTARIRADPWQATQPLGGVGDLSAEVRDDDLCGTQEIAPTGVVAEALPEEEYLVFARGG